MAFIDITIKWVHNSITTDITNSIVSYEREQAICSGIGTLIVILDHKAGYDFTVWDKIVLFESGSRRGTYFIAEDVKTLKNGNKQLVCQDATKKLVDYFITDVYYIDYPTYTREWIERFLDEVGVSYQFDTSSIGNLVSKNSQLGLAAAYDTIQDLLQQSGWYMFVDNDNKFHIGDLNKDLAHPNFTIRDPRILSIKTNKNDKSLRNRAVVWGEFNNDEWVFADQFRHTPWDHGLQDQRTVVLSNGNIDSSSSAYTLAQKLLDEFAQLDFVKEIEVHGYHAAELGNVARIRSKYWSGLGLVTTIGSSLSKSGLKTKITLDQKCPRLFGFYSFNSYVYVGTYGGGVWRKELGDPNWEAFTTGLTQFNVTDLMIKGGVFACTAGGKAFINTDPEFADWQEYIPGAFSDVQEFGAIGYSIDDVDAVACDIDDNTHEIYFGYRFKDNVAQSLGYYLSWIDVVNTSGERLYQYAVILDLERKDFKLMDVDKHGSRAKPTAEAPASYVPPEVLFGYRRSYPEPIPSFYSRTYGPLPSETPYNDAIHYVSDQFGIKCDVDIEGTTVTIIEDQPVKLKHFQFDEDDVQYKAEKTFAWPVSFFQSPSDGLVLLDRLLFRDPTVKEGGTEEDDIGRYYNVVDVVRYYTNFYEHNYLYLYTYRISPLIARPVYHNPVNAASTGNVYIPAPSMTTMDGITLSPGMRVLLKDQTDSTENGIYVITPFAWIRASDADQSSEMIRGLFINVLAGTVNANKAFQLNIPEDEVTVMGFTEFTFTEVLILESVGAALIGDAVELFDSYSNSNFPKSVQMIHGNIYIYFYGEKQEVGDLLRHHLSYMTIYGSGGFNTIKFDKIRNTQPGDPYPFIRVTNEQMIACGIGAAVIRTKEHYVNDTVGGGSAAIFFESFQFMGPEVEYKNKILVNNSDVNKGDWAEEQHPVHSVGTHPPSIRWVGSQLDNQITPYFLFKAVADADGMWQCCFEGTCGGGLVLSFDRSSLFSYGIINAFTCEFVIQDLYDRGVFGGGCTEFGFDDWDYTKYNFDFNQIFATTCRGQNPKFIYQGNQVWDAIQDIQIGTMTRSSVIATHLDDYDGCFYVASAGVIYKESPSGGTVAEIRYLKDRYGIPGGVFGGNGSLIVTNGLIVSHNVFPGAAGGYTVHKFDNDALFAGKKLCYLMENLVSDNENIHNRFAIKDFDFFSFKTEENKNDPLMSFTIPSGLMPYVINGNLTFGVDPEHFKVYDQFYNYQIITDPVNDIRSFDLGSNIYAEGELLNPGRGKYILAGYRDGILRFHSATNLSQSYILSNNLSGSGNTQVGRIETSNYYYPPWFFIAYSGSTIPEFFERSPSVSGFTNYSLGLPAFDLSSIRLDDRM